MSTLVAAGQDVSKLPPGAVSGPVTVAQPPAPNNQALLVTSGTSRVQTNSNISSLAGANASITPPASTPTNSNPTQTQNTGGSSNTNSNPAPFTPPTGSTLTTLPNGVQSYYNPTTQQMVDSTGKALTWNSQQNSWIDPGTGQPPTAASASDSSSSSGDTSGDMFTGLDISPGLKSAFQSTFDSLNQQGVDAKANIAALTATLNNDPAAQAAAQGIADQYDVLIKAMQDKNKQLLGRAKSAVGAFGGLGQMSQNFMSSEMDDASQRISTLVTQEQDLILKSNQAYRSGDLKALNDAQTEYNKVNTDKITALRDLLTATNNQVKNVQAQQKIDQASITAQINNDIKNSNGVAATIAAQLTKNGITDFSTYDFTDMAKQLGISDPSTLSAAVVKAGQTNQKAADVSANTADTIANRDQRTNIAQQKANNPAKAKGGGTDGAYTYTADDVSTYTNLLNEGGTSPNGTTFAARGADGFVDPGAYVAALNDWVANGGTPNGFAKKFPVKGNVNPDSYTSLPAAIQPKAANTPTYTTN